MKYIEYYSKRKHRFVKATWFGLLIRKIKHLFTKWKIINTDYYWIVPNSDRGRHFILTDKEYKKAKKLYKDKGTISYEFYPCAGIGWGIKIHILKTNEIFDITDIEAW